MALFRFHVGIGKLQLIQALSMGLHTFIKKVGLTDPVQFIAFLLLEREFFVQSLISGSG
jgi:hypothetical protein